MDAAPRGLAPSGPGATGVPLLDFILADPGLAGAVFAHLAPRDVRGLREACRGGRDAVAAHPWDCAADHAWAPPLELPLGARIAAYLQFEIRIGVAYAETRAAATPRLRPRRASALAGVLPARQERGAG
jgi:hypothetical protein